MANDNYSIDPWWKNNEQAEDYTKRRTGKITYTMDDLIGRKDVKKYILTTTTTDTVSGTGTILI